MLGSLCGSHKKRPQRDAHREPNIIRYLAQEAQHNTYCACSTTGNPPKMQISFLLRASRRAAKLIMTEFLCHVWSCWIWALMWMQHEQILDLIFAVCGDDLWAHGTFDQRTLITRSLEYRLFFADSSQESVCFLQIYYVKCNFIHCWKHSSGSCTI